MTRLEARVAVKPAVIRVGDTVRVVNSKFVRRVGYPLVWYDLLDEVKNDVRTWKAWQALTDAPMPAKFSPAEARRGLFDLYCSDLPSEFLKAVAMQRVRERGFGGKVRKLVYCEQALPDELWSADRPPDCTGAALLVVNKRHVKTGVYYPSSGDHEDYWPGGLEDMKVHTLLELHAWGWIEACNVELVRRAE